MSPWNHRLTAQYLSIFKGLAFHHRHEVNLFTLSIPVKTDSTSMSRIVSLVDLRWRSVRAKTSAGGTNLIDIRTLLVYARIFIIYIRTLIFQARKLITDAG